LTIIIFAIYIFFIRCSPLLNDSKKSILQTYQKQEKWRKILVKINTPRETLPKYRDRLLINYPSFTECLFSLFAINFHSIWIWFLFSFYWKVSTKFYPKNLIHHIADIPSLCNTPHCSPIDKSSYQTYKKLPTKY
jgi:hypothetical protein